MLLSEYSLTPDVFDVDAYGYSTSDEIHKYEFCSIYLRVLLKVLSEEAITRDLCNGELIKAIYKMPTQHPKTKVILKTLLKERRLISGRSEEFQCFASIPENDEEWCREAIKSHNLKELTGIITTKNTKRSFDDGIVGSIENLEESLWWKDRSPSIRLFRTTTEYIRHLKLILNHSKSLMFIDPYLNPSKNNYKEFIHLLKAIPTRDISPKIEIHITPKALNIRHANNKTIVETWEDMDNNQKKNKIAQAFNILKESFSKKNFGIKCFIWANFHDRYLISDLIGVNLCHGFDTQQSVKRKTTWTRLGSDDKDSVQLEFSPNINSKDKELLSSFLII